MRWHFMNLSEQPTQTMTRARGRLRGAIWLGLVLALTLVLVSCTSPAAVPANGNGNDRLLVAASIPPIADMVHQVGGERVDVLTMVPPGASPHTYEPTPEQMRRLAQARVLFLNGVGLEFWADKTVDAVGSDTLRVVTLAEGLPLLQSSHNAAGNPHLWLSPQRAMTYVERIRDALIAADPEGEATYRANAEA